MSQRFTVTTITAVGTTDYQWDFTNQQNGGWSMQVACNTAFRAQLLASEFDDGAAGTFTDVTSMLTGGANIGVALNAHWFLNQFHPHRIRLVVDSVSAGTFLKVAMGL